MSAAASLTCSAENIFPITVVRAVGELDATTVTTVHTALVKALADDPTALVVDVSHLVCRHSLWLTVFATIARRAAQWPGTELILCGAGFDLTQRLRTGATRHLPRYATLAEGIAVAGERPAPREVRLFCPPATDAPAQARAAAMSAFERWNLPLELRQSGEVVVSELVTNAVRHAGTTAELTVRLTERYVHVAVRDGVLTPPRRQRSADPYAEGGRGLGIVELITTAWGVATRADGKVVWATLRRPRPAQGQR